MYRLIGRFYEDADGMERETLGELIKELGIIGSLSADVGDIELFYGDEDHPGIYAIAIDSEHYYGSYRDKNNEQLLKGDTIRAEDGSIHVIDRLLGSGVVWTCDQLNLECNKVEKIKLLPTKKISMRDEFLYKEPSMINDKKEYRGYIKLQDNMMNNNIMKEINENMVNDKLIEMVCPNSGKIAEIHGVDIGKEPGYSIRTMGEVIEKDGRLILKQTSDLVNSILEDSSNHPIITATQNVDRVRGMINDLSEEDRQKFIDSLKASFHRNPCIHHCSQLKIRDIPEEIKLKIEERRQSFLNSLAELVEGYIPEEIILDKLQADKE